MCAIVLNFHTWPNRWPVESSNINRMSFDWQSVTWARSECLRVAEAVAWNYLRTSLQGDPNKAYKQAALNWAKSKIVLETEDRVSNCNNKLCKQLCLSAHLSNHYATMQKGSVNSIDTIMTLYSSNLTFSSLHFERLYWTPVRALEHLVYPSRD